ncbi:MAG TPA: alpha/beta hydrolase [Polyangiaceae bacterium]|nr:alpha/beta hydrolase [Polyangiaceae bacterium]
MAAEMADVVRRNNVTVQGSGALTLLLAHGLGCDQNVWHRVAPALARDHRVVSFDHVGAGRSDRAAYDPARYGSLEGYAQDLAEVARTLGPPAPVLVAHSISGTLGLMASAAAPGLFDRMVLLAPNPCFLNHPPDYFGGLERSDVDDFLALMEQNFLGWAEALVGMVARDAETARAVSAGISAADPRALRRFAELVFHSDVRELLPRVRARALVVQCSDDAVAPRSVGEFMCRKMPAATYRLVDVIGHCPQLSRPALVEGLVREFAAAA